LLTIAVWCIGSNSQLKDKEEELRRLSQQPDIYEQLTRSLGMIDEALVVIVSLSLWLWSL